MVTAQAASAFSRSGLYEVGHRIAPTEDCGGIARVVGHGVHHVLRHGEKRTCLGGPCGIDGAALLEPSLELKGVGVVLKSVAEVLEALGG